jgi:hypothetical protein
MNFILKHVIQENIYGTERQGRRCWQLMDDLEERRRYGDLKEEGLDRAPCGTCRKTTTR